MSQREEKALEGLLQPAVVPRLMVRRVAGSVAPESSGSGKAKVKHRPLLVGRLTGPIRSGTSVGGQFGWGGTHPKSYRVSPMVGLGRTETGLQLHEDKPA